MRLLQHHQRTRGMLCLALAAIQSFEKVGDETSLRIVAVKSQEREHDGAPRICHKVRKALSVMLIKRRDVAVRFPEDDDVEPATFSARRTLQSPSLSLRVDEHELLPGPRQAFDDHGGRVAFSGTRYAEYGRS